MPPNPPPPAKHCDQVGATRPSRRQPLAANPRQELHALIECLSEEEARRLSLALLGAAATTAAPKPRPLTRDDVALAEPVLPEDEAASADDVFRAYRARRTRA